MGKLVDAWNHSDEGAHDFLEQWERDHPACGKTRAELDAAVDASHLMGDSALAECVEYRRKLFWRALGQEPPEPGPLDGKTKEQVEAAVKAARLPYSPEGGLNEFYRALGEEPPEDDRDQRIAELEKAFATERRFRRAQIETTGKFHKERNEALKRIADLEKQLNDRGLELSDMEKRMHTAESKQFRIVPTDERVAELEAEVERLKAQPIPPGLVDAMLDAAFGEHWAARGIATSPNAMPNELAAARAVAEKYKPHGTWVPFKVGDRVRCSGLHNVVTVESIQLAFEGLSGCYPPSFASLAEAGPPDLVDAIGRACYGKAVMVMGTNLSVTRDQFEQAARAVAEKWGKPGPPRCSPECGACVREDPFDLEGKYWTGPEEQGYRDGQFCPDCGELLEEVPDAQH